MAVDPSQKWCYCHNQTAEVVSRDDVARVLGWPIREKGPGLCTSGIATPCAPQCSAGARVCVYFSVCEVLCDLFEAVVER